MVPPARHNEIAHPRYTMGGPALRFALLPPSLLSTGRSRVILQARNNKRTGEVSVRAKRRWPEGHVQLAVTPVSREQSMSLAGRLVPPI